MTSMLRTDTGNFNRFLTSLGLLFLAAALLIPYFFFRNTDILTIPGSDLQLMTAQGRAAVLERQDAISDLEPWVLGGAIFLGVIGATLLVAGGLRLKAAQESEDEETELRKRRARLEMQSLSPEERAQKTAEKAREEDQHPPRPSTPEAGVSSSAARSERRTFIDDRKKIVERVEQRIEKVFSDSPISSHQLDFQVKASSERDALRLDGVFRAVDEGQPDVILKTRVAFSPKYLKHTARQVADDLIAQSSRYQAMTRRPTDGWLITILPEDADEELPNDAVDALSEQIEDALGTFGEATLIRESDVTRLPEIFVARFGHTFVL